MSSFEVYYVVQKDPYKEQRDKIVAGPYYEYIEAYSTSTKLEKDCSHGLFAGEYSFEVMTHMIELN